MLQSYIQMRIIGILMVTYRMCCYNVIDSDTYRARTLPWGTPDVQLTVVERAVPTPTYWIRYVAKDRNQFRARPVIPKSNTKWPSRMLRSIVSNAAEISSDSRKVTRCSRAAVMTSLITLTDAVSVEWPGMYADWKSLKFPVDMIRGCSLLRATLSISLVKVLRFVTGFKIDISDLSSPVSGQLAGRFYHCTRSAASSSASLYCIVCWAFWCHPEDVSHKPFSF